MQEAKLHVPGDAAAIREIERLAQEAGGNFRGGTISPPPGAVGLPVEVPFLARGGKSPEIIDQRKFLEAWRTAPERRRGTAKVTTLQSFIDLANRHKDDGSAIFAQTNWPAPALTAIIDYHTLGHDARFADHKIHYAFPLTEEFKAWIGANGKGMSQTDFATFIEDRIADLAAPMDAEIIEYEKLFRTKFAIPSEMVELSRGLQVRVAATVKQNVMLQSGEGEIVFTEEHQNDRGEKIVVPGLFMLSVPAFIDGESVRIPARLRYRVKDGKIIWAFYLYKWEEWLRVRVKNDLDQAAKETSLPAFEGAPED